MTLDHGNSETGTATCPFAFSTPPPLRVVLDTNVLVSLWIFKDSRLAPLRHALEDRRWRALTNAACSGEFARVLAYPQFAVEAERQRVALSEYRALAEDIPAGGAEAEPLPRCQDRDDQKFLELARDGRAHWLVTADKALLKLARRQRLAHLFRIITPDAALGALSE